MSTFRNARGKLLRLGVTGAVLAVAALATASLSGSALAAPAPVSPAPGGTVTDSHPTFTWQLPLYEEASAISIATSPEIGTDGYFFNENQVAFDTLDDLQTSWQSSSQLGAGHYWWSVRTWYDNGGYEDGDYGRRWSTPVDFTLPVQLLMACSPKMKSRLLTLGCAWDGNAKEIVVAVRVTKGAKTYVNKGTRDAYHVQGTPESEGWAWKAPKAIKNGSKVTVTVTASAAQNGVSGMTTFKRTFTVK